jgi:hypothetical protein
MLAIRQEAKARDMEGMPPTTERLNRSFANETFV